MADLQTDKRGLNGERSANKRALADHLRTSTNLGVVYFVGQDEGGPVKIGYASDLWDRFRHLRLSSPVPLSVLAALTGSKVMEREYHQRFKSCRLHGEWFERSAEVQAEIDRVNDSQRLNRRPSY